MADKIEYSRLLLKRTTNSGVVPTIPTGSTLNTFTNTDTFVGELFLNVVDDRLWVRTNNGQVEIPLSGGTGFTESLSQTLSNGNTTGGNNIVMSQDDRIYAFTGDTYIEFNKVNDPLIKLYSSDLVNGSSDIGLTPQDLSIGYSNTGTTIGQIGIDDNSLDLTFTDGTETSTLTMTPSVFTLDTTFGNIQSILDLDPEQANNGTQLRTQDNVSTNYSVVLVRESDIVMESYQSGNSSSISFSNSDLQIQNPFQFVGDNGVGFWSKFNTIGTTGNTPTDIVSIDTGTAPFGNNRVYKVICHYTLLNSTYTSGYTTEVRGTFVNNGGTLRQVGSLEYIGTRSEFTGLTDPDIYISGDEIRGRVTGITGQTLTFSVVMMIHHYG